MKRIFKFCIFIGTAFLLTTLHTSCGGQKEDPIGEMKAFGKQFIAKANANQLDSLATYYVDIAKADSIITLQGDSVIVAETGTPGQYDITLAQGITLKANRADDGTITVTESKGLFAFPADKMDIAKKTGMWEATLTDAQLAERMADNDFFSYIKKNSNADFSNIIKISKGNGGYTLTNQTDIPISGSDYKIQATSTQPVYDPDMPFAVDHWATKTSFDAGKDIAPHGSVQYNATYTTSTEFGNETNPKEVKGIKWNLSQEQLQEKFASNSGHEYQDYLTSKK